MIRGGYWGGYVNAYPRPYYGGPYRSAYYDYPPPRYYGGGYYPSYGVVYHERPVVRRVVRTIYVEDDRRNRRYDDRYGRDEDYGGRSPFPAYGAHAGIFQQYLFYGRIAQKG